MNDLWLQGRLVLDKIKPLSDDGNEVFFICEHSNPLVAAEATHEVYCPSLASPSYLIFDKV